MAPRATLTSPSMALLRRSALPYGLCYQKTANRICVLFRKNFSIDTTLAEYLEFGAVT